MKYTLYHIKKLKWGCTRRTLKQRFSDQDYRKKGLTTDDVCETEIYTNRKEASDREYELNVLNNYKGQLSKYEDYIGRYEKLHTYSPLSKPHTKTKEHRENISKSRKGKSINHPGNPEHFIGYASKPGEANGNSTLTKNDVLEIRAKYIPKVYTQRQLSEEYGVCRMQINRILNRSSWPHI